MAVPVVNIIASDAEPQAAMADVVARAVEVVMGGGIVVLPTETVYGAAAVLTNARALDRLRELRPGAPPRPFTIHLAEGRQAMRYIDPPGELGRRMVRKLWPGPVGLIFQVSAGRRAEVSAGLGVAETEVYEGELITLRCPDHPVATAVLSAVSGPVVASAIGAAGEYPAFKAESLASQLEGKVDLVLDAGPTRYAKPSTLLRVGADRWQVVRAGVYDERIIGRKLRTTILFVCSGNTCRSPMAEALARRLLAKRLNVSVEELEKRGVSVVSAGSFAMPGARATTPAVVAMKDMGADLTRHRSRPLTVELIHEADVVFTMGRSHSAAVTALVPAAADKVVTLDPRGDIDDPIGADVEHYRNLAGQLQTLIEKRLEERELV